MMELSISECFKEHYKRHNTMFIDSEWAAISWNSVLPISEKLTALREILDTTADDVLKTQIQERLNIEAEIESAFRAVTFKISKAILEDKLESNADGRILLGGEAEFKKDGKLSSLRSQIPAVRPYIHCFRVTAAGKGVPKEQLMKQAGISRKSFYKYKRELREETA